MTSMALFGVRPLNRRAVSGTDSVLASDDALECDTTGGAFTETLLPIASAPAKRLEITFTSAAYNLLTLSGDAPIGKGGQNTFGIAAPMFSCAIWPSSDRTYWNIGA